jgi:hypothetical protein
LLGATKNMKNFTQKSNKIGIILLIAGVCIHDSFLITMFIMMLTSCITWTCNFGPFLTCFGFAEPRLGRKACGRLIHLLSPRHPIVSGGAEPCPEVDSRSHFSLSVTSSLLHDAPHVRGLLFVVRCHEVSLPGLDLCEIWLGTHPLCVKENSLVNKFLRLWY